VQKEDVKSLKRDEKRQRRAESTRKRRGNRGIIEIKK